MDKQELIEYCLSFPNVCVEYPYGPQYTALKYSPTRRIFAVVYERENRLCIELIIDYCDTDEEFGDIIPAHLMYKEGWSAVVIGGDVRKKDLLYFIRRSYAHVVPKLRTHNKTVVTRGYPWPINFYCYVYGITGGLYPDMPEAPEEAIELVLNMFSPREKEIILSRYKDYMTFAEIGKLHGISGCRVQQIHVNIMRNIRRTSKLKYLVSDPPDPRASGWCL